MSPHSTQRSFLAAFVLVLAMASLSAAPARAEPLRLVAGGAVQVNESPGISGNLDFRLVFGGGVQLGLALRAGALDRAYPGGYAERGAIEYGGAAVALFPLLKHGALALDLRTVVGATQLSLSDAQPHDAATRLNVELAMFARVTLSELLTLRVGAVLGYDQELSPSAETADQSQRLTVGLLVHPAPTWAVYALVDGGGTYGFDGDNAKMMVRGELGVRVALGGDVLPLAF